MSQPSCRRTFPFAMLTAPAALGMLMIVAPMPVAAHGFSSVIFADLTSPEPGVVTTALGLEYDLLVVSVADAEDADPLFQQGIAAFDAGDSAAQAAALAEHRDSVFSYIDERFSVASDAGRCESVAGEEITMTEREGVPYAALTLTQTCPSDSGPFEIESRLFPDGEGYVAGATTIVTYDLGGQSGSAVLDAAGPPFSAGQGLAGRLGEFFLLGAEHLLGGLDHILFLLALIVGSRRLREVVLAATTFTVAHSITFILAATGAVYSSPQIVEPVIALSISVVAAWYLWQLWRKRSRADAMGATTGVFRLDRAAWVRLAVVFVFGLVHGLGFAGALGIEEPWSWNLLGSLLVFNVGIEVVQIGIIAVVFTLLVLLRRRSALSARWVAGVVAGGVAATGLVWFVERIVGG